VPTLIIVRGLATSGSRRGAGVPTAKMLDTREYATLEDLARAKGVDVTYVSRILQLTPLAPEIVEAIDPRPPADRANVAV
jgi:hypothetical protein